MNKTGLVLKVDKNTATIVTTTGEFIKVTTSKNPPKIGETYTGIVKREKKLLRPFVAAAAIALFFLSSAGLYAYSVPAATVEVTINPSIELKLNYFNKIIKSIPLNEDGNTLLKNIDLKNKSIDEALTLIVSQAKKDNFINEAYIDEGKVISVKILSKNKNLNISNFEKYIDNNELNTNIDNNGKKVKKDFPKEKSPLNHKNNKDDKTLSPPPENAKEKENKNNNSNNNSQTDKERHNENKSNSNGSNNNKYNNKNSNNNSNNKNNDKTNSNNDRKNDKSNKENNTEKESPQNMKKK